MTYKNRAEELFARWVEHHVLHGEGLRPEDLCADDPDQLEALVNRIATYEQIDQTLSPPAADRTSRPSGGGEPLPQFDGFRTIERLGGGGAGEVYKLEDLELGRTVAAKILRRDNRLNAGLAEFSGEARSLALFEDPRIVRIHEFRSRADPPVLIMEYVDGFDLARIGPSLEYGQRARIMLEVAEAIHHAHELGIQHRDLKPANVLLDASLSPRILDFGISHGDPHRGHGVGTPAYMAPEQLKPGRPIDARTDVYAMGVMLYELLSGEGPYGGDSLVELVAAIEGGKVRLPVEIEPGVPEPLQAIALKAMEPDPDQRYSSARELALELRRFLDGRPVLARPSQYQSALKRRLRPHMEQIREWLRIKLIYPHEAERLGAAYRGLEGREDDWIVESRVLSFSQIALYLGAFLLICGSLFYVIAYFLEAFEGLTRPMLVLGLPFIGLNAVGATLYRREHKAVAVAYYLGAVVLLPMLLIIFFQEMGLWVMNPENPLELFGELEDFVSNRQIQTACLVACAWTCWLALSTRTVALSAGFTVLALALHLALLAEFGLRTWFEEGLWDRLALHLVPLLAVLAALGRFMETRRRAWFARPLYLAGILLFVTILELLALDGRAMAYLHLSTASFQPPEVDDPLLLDTITAMTISGVAIYAGGWLMDRSSSSLLKSTAWFLFSISPFAILQPLFYLGTLATYSVRFDWLYLGLALAITVLSHWRQRKSFYYAGLINTGGALWAITDRHEWFDNAAWATVVVATGLLVLAIGLGLQIRERGRSA